MYINHYQCDACDGVQWSSESLIEGPEDECPLCNKWLLPHESKEIGEHDRAEVREAVGDLRRYG